MRVQAGQVAVVTGAGSGIGLAVAHAAAERRMNLVIADNDAEMLYAAERKLRQKGVVVKSLHCDVAKEAGMQHLHDVAYSTFGKVHLLFNGAGSYGPPGNLVTEVTEEEMERLLSLIQASVLRGLRMFSKSMHEGGDEGYIVSTFPYFEICRGWQLYGIAKQVVIAMMEAFQVDLTALGSKVSCAALCPSFHDLCLADVSSLHEARSTSEEQMTAKQMEGSGLSQTLSEVRVPFSHCATSLFEGIEAGHEKYIFTHNAAFTAFAKDRLGTMVDELTLQNRHSKHLLVELFEELMQKVAATESRALNIKLPSGRFFDADEVSLVSALSAESETECPICRICGFFMSVILTLL